MKKRWCSVALIGMMMASLVGCAGGSSEANSDGESSNATAQEASNSEDGGEKITLGVYFWGNQTRNEVTQKAAELYMEQNPNIELRVEFADWGGYWDKLAATTSGGNMPDVVQMDYAYLEQYVSSNSLYDLSAYISDGTINTSGIEQSIIDSGSLDGKTYAISLGSNAPCIVYDKAILEQVGIEAKDQISMEELYEWGQLIYEKTGALTMIDDGMNLLSSTARNDGKYIYDEFSAGDTSSTLKHFEYIEKFATAEFAISPELLIEKNPSNVETKPIIDGTTWNDFAFSNQFIAMGDVAERELAMMMYPTTESSSSNPEYLKPSQFFSVASTTEYPEEAAKFIDWFTNSVECNEILEGERGVPIDETVRNTLKENLSQDEEKKDNVIVYDFIDTVGKVATPIDPPNPLGYGEIDVVLKTTVENIRYGNITAADAAVEFVETAKGILEEANLE